MDQQKQAFDAFGETPVRKAGRERGKPRRARAATPPPSSNPRRCGVGRRLLTRPGRADGHPGRQRWRSADVLWAGSVDRLIHLTAWPSLRPSGMNVNRRMSESLQAAATAAASLTWKGRRAMLASSNRGSGGTHSTPTVCPSGQTAVFATGSRDHDRQPRRWSQRSRRFDVGPHIPKHLSR